MVDQREELPLLPPCGVMDRNSTGETPSVLCSRQAAGLPNNKLLIPIRFLPIKCSTERLQHLASFASLRESFFIRSSPHRAKPVLSKAEGTLSPQRILFRSSSLASFAPLRESSFIRFPKPKFNGKFQICLLSSLNFRGALEVQCYLRGHVAVNQRIWVPFFLRSPSFYVVKRA